MLLLAAPTAESLLGCQLCMQDVADHLKLFPKAFSLRPPANRPALHAAAEIVRQELAAAHALFQHASEFHQGWTHVVSARRGGYTRNGSPRRLMCYQQLLVKG